MNNKYCILLIFCLFLAFTSCKKEQSITTRNPEDDFKCITNFTKPEKEYFPFSEADSLVLVSYKLKKGEYGSRINKFKQINDTLGTIKTVERFTLTKQKIDSLTQILYKHKPGLDSITSKADCYNPRHAILFYKENHLIEFLEICLECQDMRHINQNSNFGINYDEKWCLLQKYFASIGLKQGLHKTCYF